MELLSRDPALKAALFRLVDVAPACAGRRDLAAHLASLLSEVSRPVAPAEARGGLVRTVVPFARGASLTPASGLAVGRVAGIAVQRMAKRFIVGEGPGDAVPALARLWRAGAGTSVDLLGEATVTAAEADHYAAPLRRGAAHPRRRRQGLAAPARTLDVVPRVNLSRQGHRAHRPRARRGARARHPGRQAPPPRPAAHRQGRRRPPARRHGVDGLARPDHPAGDRDPQRAGVRRRPVRGDRPAGLPARRRRSARPAARRLRARHPADDPPRQGRLLGARDRRGAPERLVRAGLRGQERDRSQLRADHQAAAGRARGGSSASRSPATTSARSPTRSPTRATRTSSSRSCAASATTSRRR